MNGKLTLYSLRLSWRKLALAKLAEGYLKWGEDRGRWQLQSAENSSVFSVREGTKHSLVLKAFVTINI